MAKIDQLFKIMFQQNASDLHLTAGSPPYLRMAGEMVKLAMKPLSNEECQVLIFEILNEKQKRLFVENWELDCSYTVEGLGRFRCNVFMQSRGLGAVFRMIPDKIKTVEDLNLPPEMLDMIRVHKGLICVTGPTGSGKSTTLAALINHINENDSSHIITVEDPIEFVHQNQRSLINQREIGGHTKSYANALKAALREDPDIILIGEMRDLETISLAITAAETGHLVFGTLHTNGAHKTIDRIIDVFPDTKQAQIRAMLSESLRGVISQALLPRQDGMGRAAVFEIMQNNKAISNLIREGKTFQIPSTMQITRNQGNITFESYLEPMMRRGTVSKQVGMEFLGKAVEDSGSKEAPKEIPVKEPGMSGGSATGSPQASGNPAASGGIRPPTPPGGTVPGGTVTGATNPLAGLANRFKKTS